MSPQLTRQQSEAGDGRMCTDERLPGQKGSHPGQLDSPAALHLGVRHQLHLLANGRRDCDVAFADDPHGTPYRTSNAFPLALLP
jgi:hypothetical protein